MCVINLAQGQAQAQVQTHTLCTSAAVAWLYHHVARLVHTLTLTHHRILLVCCRRMRRSWWWW